MVNIVQGQKKKKKKKNNRNKKRTESRDHSGPKRLGTVATL